MSHVRHLLAPFRPVALPLLGALVLATLLPPLAHAASPWYVRGALGSAESEDVTVRDLDCSGTEPPALFGCGEGIDGRPLGARGDFGDSVAFELAAGIEMGTRARVELALIGHPDLALDAEANFLGVPLGVRADQPVRADAESLAAFVVGAVDLGRADWRLQPFVSVGVGAARNEIDPVRYAFPGLSPDAATITAGGSHTDFAWTAAAGISYRLSASASLELAARYSDLGEVRTDAGEATIIRSANTFDLDIAGTRAELETMGIAIGLRYRL